MSKPLSISAEVTDKALASRLKGLPKADIKAIADAINRLGAKGFKPDDVFPIGIIINSPDGVEVRGHVAPDNIGDLTKMIPVINPKAITIFPRGIVVPDNYRVHVKLNRG